MLLSRLVSDAGHKAQGPTTEPVTMALQARTRPGPKQEACGVQWLHAGYSSPFHSTPTPAMAQLLTDVGNYLPPDLVVTDPTHPGSDERGVSQEGDRGHGVSREVGAHGAKNDIQEGLCDQADTQRGL